MSNRTTSVIILAATLVFSLLAAAPATAVDADPPAPSPGVAAAEQPAALQADEREEEEPLETLIHGNAWLGSRFVDVDGNGGRAGDYDYLKSSPTGGLFLSSLGPQRKVVLDGALLNARDYFGDLSLDRKGNYRLHLRTDSLFHNLDNLRLFPAPFALAGTNIPVQQDAASRFGIRVEQDLAEVRYRPLRYPFHLNFGYWRLLREGDAQLRFADHEFGSSATVNRVIARGRRIDRQTHEGKAGFDTHLGPVDIVYLFQIRQFYDSAAVQRDPFVARPTRAAGTLEHNVDPDSRFLSHTVKLHSSLSGGLVGAASYTYGKRDNLSRLADTSGAGQSSATLHNVAGDLVYTPLAAFSLALKYRRQTVNLDNPAFITSAAAISPAPQVFPFTPVAGVLSVRPSPDTERDQVSFIASYRPLKLLTLNGEYRGEFLHRSNTGPTPMLWNLPEETATHRGSLTLLSRPVKGVRLKAGYSYTTTDHPAYGSSAEESHNGELFVTYNTANAWGATAGYRTGREKNSRFSITTLSLDATPPVPVVLPRDKESHIASGSVWVTPCRSLTLTAGYNFLRTAVDQAVLISIVTPGIATASTFVSQAHLYSLTAAYRLNEEVEFSLVGEQARTTAEFAPELVVNGSTDTGGIREISRLRTVENSLSARADYRFSRNLSCTLNYGVRAFDEKDATFRDGTVHTVAASVTAKW